MMRAAVMLCTAGGVVIACLATLSRVQTLAHDVGKTAAQLEAIIVKNDALEQRHKYLEGQNDALELRHKQMAGRNDVLEQRLKDLETRIAESRRVSGPPHRAPDPAADLQDEGPRSLAESAHKSFPMEALRKIGVFWGEREGYVKREFEKNSYPRNDKIFSQLANSSVPMQGRVEIGWAMLRRSLNETNCSITREVYNDWVKPVIDAGKLKRTLEVNPSLLEIAMDMDTKCFLYPDFSSAFQFGAKIWRESGLEELRNGRLSGGEMLLFLTADLAAKGKRPDSGNGETVIMTAVRKHVVEPHELEKMDRVTRFIWDLENDNPRPPLSIFYTVPDVHVLLGFIAAVGSIALSACYCGGHSPKVEGNIFIKITTLVFVNVLTKYAPVVTQFLWRGDAGYLHFVFAHPWSVSPAGVYFLVGVLGIACSAFFVMEVRTVLKLSSRAASLGPSLTSKLAQPSDVYQDPDTPFCLCAVTFAGAVCLFRIYASYFDKVIEMTPGGRLYYVLAIVVQINLGIGKPDDKQTLLQWLIQMSPGVRQLELWSAMLAGKVGQKPRLRQAETLMRMAFSYISNGFFRAAILYTLPAFLAKSCEKPIDFVLNATALTYIYQFDDPTDAGEVEVPDIVAGSVDAEDVATWTPIPRTIVDGSVDAEHAANRTPSPRTMIACGLLGN